MAESSADTPRVPDLWWAPTPQWRGSFFGIYKGRYYPLVAGLGVAELPADAVKLGDVEGLRAEVEKRAELWKQQALDLNESTVKLAEIRAVLVDWEFRSTPEDAITTALAILAAPAAQLDDVKRHPAWYQVGSPEREAWERRHMDEVSRQDIERGEV